MNNATAYEKSLRVLAHDVVRLSRATIPEEISHESWFVIERGVLVALQALTDYWRTHPPDAGRSD